MSHPPFPDPLQGERGPSFQFRHISKSDSLFWKWMGFKCCPSSYAFLYSDQKRNRTIMTRMKKWSLWVQGRGVSGGRQWRCPDVDDNWKTGVVEKGQKGMWRTQYVLDIIISWLDLILHPCVLVTPQDAQTSGVGDSLIELWVLFLPKHRKKQPPFLWISNEVQGWPQCLLTCLTHPWLCSKPILVIK